MSRTVTVKITKNNFVGEAQRLEQIVDEELNEAAQRIVRDAQVAIASPPKTGRIYKRGNVTHQASAPGEAPATDTGNLANSGTVRRVGWLHFECVFSAEYAPILEPPETLEGVEFGSPSGKILPRPFLRPAVYKQAPILQEALDDALRRG